MNSRLSAIVVSAIVVSAIVLFSGNALAQVNKTAPADTLTTTISPSERAARAERLAARLRAASAVTPASRKPSRRTASPLDQLGAGLDLHAPGGPPQRAWADGSAAAGHGGHLSLASDIPGAALLPLDAETAAREQLAHTSMPLLRAPAEELEVTTVSTDPGGTRHVRLRQVYDGVPVYGAEVILHQPERGSATVTGRVRLSPKLASRSPELSKEEAIRLAGGSGAHRQSGTSLVRALSAGLHEDAELYYVEHDGRYRLSYLTETAPTLGEHYVSFVDAVTGEVYDRYSERCDFVPNRIVPDRIDLASTGASASAALPPRTATARDINGVTRTLQVFDNGRSHFLIDGTRRSFGADGAVPGGERGALVTGNAQRTSPQTDDFSAVYAASGDNTWTDAAEVSAHYNTEVSYEYFERVFGRNSLDGSGGTVTAFVNVVDEDGDDFDNAFYVNGLMFYGNGAGAASNWTGSLDVGAHEMSHGVVDFSANLEYRDESGALNEHFADLFAVMVDRDDWRVGEEIVNDAVFRSGAIRDFADPSNGGTSLADRGFQPEHYRDRYTGSQDNGGVHINSGIPNHVAYLTAQAIGREKTEQIWYLALTEYLGRTSQFVDFRAAVQQAALQRYGQAEADAASRAMDVVGMPGQGTGGTGGGGNPGGGTGTTQQTNPGTELIAASDDGENLVRLFGLDGATVIGDMTPSAYPASRISVSDDGSVALLATRDGDINLIEVDYTTNTVSDNVIDGDLDDDGSGDVRNVALSRDGTRIALLTDDYDATLYVLDLVTQQSRAFELYSPGSNGERLLTVAYADAMEWDYSGRYVVLDQLNTVATGGGTTRDYWEIAVLEAYEGDVFGAGTVNKLFGNLAPGVSIGNPTLAKNSEHVIAYDYWDGEGVYETRAVDILTGEGNTLWRNDRLGWPTFTASDRYVLFDARDNSDNQVVAFAELGDDKISNPSGNASVFQTDYRKAYAYANGQREFVNAIAELAAGAKWTVGPNPTTASVRVFRRADASPATGQFEVYDMTGRMVLSVPAGALEIDLSPLAPGNYFLRQGQQERLIVRQ